MLGGPRGGPAPAAHSCAASPAAPESLLPCAVRAADGPEAACEPAPSSLATLSRWALLTAWRELPSPHCRRAGLRTRAGPMPLASTLHLPRLPQRTVPPGGSGPLPGLLWPVGLGCLRARDPAGKFRAPAPRPLWASPRRAEIPAHQQIPLLTAASCPGRRLRVLTLLQGSDRLPDPDVRSPPPTRCQGHWAPCGDGPHP